MDLSPPRGTDDLLPPHSSAMLALERDAGQLAERYGYRFVETPAFEHTELFARTAGETSDVVRKEMYTFEDRSGRSLTLRPEGTAPVVRAYLRNAHSLPAPFKAYYVEPMWRYGRPQAGRTREFRSFGVEVIGAADPPADVEVIGLADRYLRETGLQDFELQVNSIGDEACRPQYRAGLLEFLESQAPRITDEHRDGFRDNPLRVLDCKDASCREVAEDAPKITDHLCAACKEHFDRVLAGLEAEAITARVESTLVRGLDYYTRTAFEFVSGSLHAAQSTLCGGGRYDGLAEVLGGAHTPGIGFGLGLDRVLLALDAEGAPMPGADALTCFVIGVGPGSDRVRELVRLLRGAGVSADASFEERPLKAQLRMADRTGARFALIVGEREVADGVVTVRRFEDGHQDTVPMTDVAAWIARQA